MIAKVQPKEFLNLQDLRVLQVLVYWLQQPTWPKDAKISREQAFTLIVNLAPNLDVKIDPANINQLKKDPNFLVQVALKIAQLLLQKQTPSIPPNLKELVTDYEKHLVEDRTEQARQVIQKRIEQLLQEANPLLKKEENRPVCQDAAAQITKAIESYIPPLSPEEKFPLAEINEVLEKALPEIEKYLPYAGVKSSLQPQMIKSIRNAVNQTLPQFETIAKAPTSQRIVAAETKEATLKTLYPRLDETTKKNHQQLIEQIKTEIITFHPELTQLPVLADNLSNQLANTFVVTLPQIARKEAFKLGEFQRNLESIQSVIEQTLKQAGIEPKINKEKLAEISQKTLPVIQNLAVTPHTSFSSLLPTTKKAALKASFIHFDESTENLYQQLEEKVQKSLQTIEILKNNPLAQQIVAERVSFALLSQIPSDVISLEQRQASISQTVAQELKRIGFELPPQETLSQTTADISQQTESEIATLATIPRTFITLPEFLETERKRIFQEIKFIPGKSVIHFVLPDKIIRLITFGKVKSFTALKTATSQKIVQPVLIWLGKTAIGKTIKAGTKKLITWGLGKLGLAAIPEPVVSKALLVLSFLKDAVSLLKRGLKRLLEKPELAIFGGLALIGLPILIPMLPALGFIFTAAGIISAGIGFLSKAGSFMAGIAGKVGGFLSSAASTISGAFSSLATISLPSALPVIAVGGTVGTVAVATTLVIVTAGSTFIQPKIPYRYISPFPPTVIQPKCPDEFINKINEIAQANCIPPAILMAISRMEASGAWSWTCEEIKQFSQPKWWEDASQAEKDKGYCYDTCARSGLCSGTTVMGPMQFEEKTWQGFMPGYDLMDRCRLDLSLLAAAKKIKTNSGTSSTNCGPWDEKTVRHVAYRYCGSCGTYGCQLNPDPNDTCSSACGYDYCSNVWYLYQQYESQ